MTDHTNGRRTNDERLPAPPMRGVGWLRVLSLAFVAIMIAATVPAYALEPMDDGSSDGGFGLEEMIEFIVIFIFLFILFMTYLWPYVMGYFPSEIQALMVWAYMTMLDILGLMGAFGGF